MGPRNGFLRPNPTSLLLFTPGRTQTMEYIVTGSTRSPESCTSFLPSPWLLTFTALARHEVCGLLSMFSCSRAAAAIRQSFSAQSEGGMQFHIASLRILCRFDLTTDALQAHRDFGDVAAHRRRSRICQSPHKGSPINRVKEAHHVQSGP